MNLNSWETAALLTARLRSYGPWGCLIWWLKNIPEETCLPTCQRSIIFIFFQSQAGRQMAAQIQKAKSRGRRIVLSSSISSLEGRKPFLEISHQNSHVSWSELAILEPGIDKKDALSWLTNHGWCKSQRSLHPSFLPAFLSRNWPSPSITLCYFLQWLGQMDQEERDKRTQRQENRDSSNL